MTSAYQTPPMVQGGRPPTASVCQGDGVEPPPKEASVKQATTIGLDIAKHVFQVHGADGAGHVLFRKRITRMKLLSFLAAQTRCVVAMEACAGAHYWAREIAKLGHHVRLIAPGYVKPFIKRQKNDAADAEAISEAAQRPSMRFVPVKTEEQQANGIVFRARDLLVRQRTQCVNALRGHLMEYGYVFPKGITHVETQAGGCLPAASKAGQMTASDHAQQRPQRFPLPERGRPQMGSHRQWHGHEARRLRLR